MYCQWLPPPIESSRLIIPDSNLCILSGKLSRLWIPLIYFIPNCVTHCNKSMFANGLFMNLTVLFLELGMNWMDCSCLAAAPVLFFLLPHQLGYSMFQKRVAICKDTDYIFHGHSLYREHILTMYLKVIKYYRLGYPFLSMRLVRGGLLYSLVEFLKPHPPVFLLVW